MRSVTRAALGACTALVLSLIFFAPRAGAVSGISHAQAVVQINWQVLPGAARDIGIGGDQVWVIGTNRVPGGYGIYHWNGSGWEGMPGGAVAIDVDSNGFPWVINSAHNIFRWNGSSWDGLPGLARDIGIGADDSVWVIGTNRVPGGYGIYQWNGSGWDYAPGGAVRIDVDSNGNPWVVNSAHNIYQGS